MPNPAATLKQFREQCQHINNFQNEALSSNIQFEPVIVNRIEENKNMVTITLQSGIQYENIRLKNSVQEVLFFHEEPAKLKNISGVLYYKIIPEDGYVELSNLQEDEFQEELTSSNPPFYL